jgi:hypothetical protein
MHQRTALPERFANKVIFNAPNGCWLWVGARNEKGYGLYKSTGRMVRAHRFAYETLVGPIPEGKSLDHTCFTHECVNPKHLRPVTTKQNGEHRRGAQKNSKTGVRGVSWSKSRSRYRAQAWHNGRTVEGGYFHTILEAEQAVIALRARLFTHDDMEVAS